MLRNNNKENEKYIYNPKSNSTSEPNSDSTPEPNSDSTPEPNSDLTPAPSSNSNNGQTKKEKMENFEKKASRLSIWLVILVLLVKVAAAIFTNSLTFFAELSDTTLDMFTVGITALALKQSKKPADLQHMFGHYKINSMAGFIQALLLIILYTNIFYQAAKAIWLRNFSPVSNSLIAIISIGMSIFITWLFSKSLIQLGKKSKNQAIIAQATNFKSDMLRNLAVMIGLVFIGFGFIWLDKVLAAIFAIYAISEGIEILKTSFNELIDVNQIPESVVETLKEEIKKFPAVHEIIKFQIKTLGSRLDANVVISLDKKISSTRLHFLSQAIEALFYRYCPTYENHVIIQSKVSNSSLNSSQNLFKVIHQIIASHKGEYRIHQVHLDQFENKLVLQFHVEVDPKLSLEKAHSTISDLEHHFMNDLSPLISSQSKIEVISHIEPAFYRDKIHSHPYEQHISEKLGYPFKEKVMELINGYKTKILLSKCEILEEDPYFSVALTIKMEDKITVAKSHLIAEKLKWDLRYSFDSLTNCLIHVEPFNYYH